MDDDMVVELPVFEVREIDLDYEFDAACFYDFTREESIAEACEAELWFDSAPNYPPSPFVAKFFQREDILLENVNTSSKTKVTSSLENDSYNVVGAAFLVTKVEDGDFAGMSKGNFTNIQSGNLQKVPNQPLNLTAGLKFYDHIAHDKVKANAKSAKKSHPRSSTLMKPTTSHLAKQNRPVQVGSSRFQTHLFQNGEWCLCTPPVVESQAIKRQKLEGGHLRKVADINSETNLVHKAPKRSGNVDKNSQQARLRLTIPREPDLETAHRAQRIRPKVIAKQENLTTATRRFKACPLNRKILDAPTLPLPKKSMPRLPEFQEFRLKTLERAMQRTSAVSSSTLHCSAFDKELDKAVGSSVLGNGNREFERIMLTLGSARILPRPSGVNTVKQDGFDTVNNFKARPLNKILDAPTLPLPKKSMPRLPEFQEFRLKTLERAMQRTSAVSSSTLHCSAFDKELDKAGGSSVLGNGNREFERIMLTLGSARILPRPSGVNTVKQDGFDTMNNFKARPLNKEFNFQTEKIQPNPPIDLFSKLSLKSEQQPSSGSQLPRRTCIPIKSSKENRVNSYERELVMTQLVKERTSAFGEKQNIWGNDGCINGAVTHLSMRSLGIR